ncbi:amino acid/amide ABC transporter membrane protein 1 (HAAT family) /amino acid/amide ABC transporter membrane protein 2 (HAAT family) [Stella humosa]|uniref:Amino acid/amide ABC transporter membrane protein 1 (HAAT family) /amino acid/amide ABC transporter membrane protein 2 (HAAT family) n=1 Tax=Stella humosa TaxID=94 RepID=A0A3N1MAL4_9PROT|nr:ABC transporter permease [Stella humosa]ROQ00309.1 amino acid/amide ABC transporter membrane protein 1 (HAAT family) /amino acid/amide ABC transporter membrane protein 2 (HAAT family) [Stella humosa]BBK30453.1 ABC transporter permease [Stella humosa]
MDIQTLAQLVLSGLTIGCVYSLVGLGFALTLRATELINFAQGEMVMLGGFLGLSLLLFTGLPYAVVFLLVLLATGLVGVLLERTILRPILDRRAPLLNLLIATLGLSIAMQAVAIIIWGREPIAYPVLFSAEPIIVFGLRVQALNLWILGLGLGVMAALQYFFQRTMAGISWRAASLDPSTAALYGVNRRRNVALTFGISGALGGAAGVLIAPMFFASFGIGHGVIIKAFAAGAIGGFGIVGTMLGGLALGVIETLAAGTISSEYKNVITYSALLVILMAFYRPTSRTGRSITEGAKVATSGAVELLSRGTGRAVLVLGGIFALWLGFLLLADTYALRITNMALLSAIAVLGLQLIVGYTGAFSFGHAAFYGVGAYASALLTMKLGVPFVLAVPLAAMLAGLAGLLVAPLLRLSGHFLAIGTLAMGEIVNLLMLNWKWLTNGAYGIYGIPLPNFAGWELESEEGFFVLISGVLALTWFFLRRLTRSRFGRSLVAVRENELAAVASGIPADRQKIVAFVIGTACAGLAGALYAHYIAYINPESFHFLTSVQMVTMVVIGGLGSLPGGIVGALVVSLLPEVLRVLADYRLVVYGGLLILFMMFLPGGLADIGRRAWRLVAGQR